MFKGKCGKSVLGEFGFGVSVCCNKGTQTDLGSLFARLPPGRELRGALTPALAVLEPY